MFMIFFRNKPVPFSFCFLKSEYSKDSRKNISLKKMGKSYEKPLQKNLYMLYFACKKMKKYLSTNFSSENIPVSTPALNGLFIFLHNC